MSQDYVALSSPAEPFRLVRGSSNQAQVLLVGRASLIWASGGSADVYDPANDAHSSAINLYTVPASPLFDATQYTWILLAVKGAATPMLAMEVDSATYDTLTGGNWAVLARVAGGILYPIPGI